MPPIIEINDLYYKFPNYPPVLDGVNLSIEENSFDILAGTNGSGKTLLIKHINTLLSPGGGTVLYRGKNVEKVKEIRQKVGLVFQNADSQFVAQSVFREIAFGPSNLGLKRDTVLERVEYVMEVMNLKKFKDRNPHSLSGGEKRRLAIASVLAMEPEIIILDEPFTGLDLTGVKTTLKSLMILKDLGKTILVVTHDVEKCLAHSDRVHILDNGKIALSTEPHKILPELENWNIYSPWQKDRPIESYTWLRG